MTNGSKISKPATGHSKRPHDGDSARAAARRRERRQWYKLLAPRNVPHRRREARRWLDELTVRITNGRVCERRPGQRLFASVAEREAVADGLRDTLRRDDPELYGAVERLQFEDGTRDIGITLKEWKVRSARRSKHISKVRAEMQRAGLI
jgi:hypothetical protein